MEEEEYFPIIYFIIYLDISDTNRYFLRILVLFHDTASFLVVNMDIDNRNTIIILLRFGENDLNIWAFFMKKIMSTMID